MSTVAQDRKQINVRVPTQVADLLTEKVASEKRAGRKVTKDQLVADAITAAYGHSIYDDDGWLPVFEGKWIAPIDGHSNSEMLDYLDRTEAEGLA